MSEKEARELIAKLTEKQKEALLIMIDHILQEDSEKETD